MRLRKGRKMTTTPGQVRAARRLLGWWQSDLAKMVRVSEKSIRAFESGELSGTSPLDLGLVRESLEAAGVIFVEENGEGPGVRLRKINANDAR
jgi:ribosome-binding protein aMBF1 (putative translation factor)